MSLRDKTSILVKNPILKGFHPDPSICKVDEQYYIACSTFEYFPGVAIFTSSNLQHWEFCSYALERKSQLDMTGNPPSGGIWAPCLSYSEGRYFLIYTDVKSWTGTENGEGFKDCHNYLVRSTAIYGPWSDPVYLNSSGFDPSLFHDDDGRKWLVNVLWDYRPWNHSFGGIVLQEFDDRKNTLIGPIRNIFKGSDLQLTEAPHIYRRNGWYYLMTAEGGTSYMHAVTLARSRNIEGPYELHPHKHLLTAVANRNQAKSIIDRKAILNGSEALHKGLQKAGHGSMAAWTNDQWILSHLSARPLEGTDRCPLGRETSIQRIQWEEDDWPYLLGSGASEEVEFSIRNGVSLADNEIYGETWCDDFDSDSMDYKIQTLRNPWGESLSLKKRQGWLRLYGGESPESRFNQIIAVRRVQHFTWSANTLTDYISDNFQQFAGLIVRYDESTQHILRISEHNSKRCLGIISYDRNYLSMPLGEDEIILTEGKIHLGVDVSYRDLQFRYSLDGMEWIRIGPVYDASKLSDDYVKPMGFTGTFVGIGSWDVSGRRRPADFDFLKYTGR